MRQASRGWRGPFEVGKAINEEDEAVSGFDCTGKLYCIATCSSATKSSDMENEQKGFTHTLDESTKKPQRKTY